MSRRWGQRSWSKRPTKTLLVRFLSKIKFSVSGCWVWTGHRNKAGYGKIRLGVAGTTMEYAHRVSWKLFQGKLNSQLEIDHKCHNTSCARPDHLRQVTGLANKLGSPESLMSRMRVRALSDVCPAGHNSYRHLIKKGGRRKGLPYRFCLECSRIGSHTRRTKERRVAISST